ncbi:SCO family protein [Poriferisphaera sp. WC338]|uniref:SCO family protein n=1 Tax=Poriferisphaera sp. WC338 TaxID=3425129 RepID=UPI003D81B734
MKNTLLRQFGLCPSKLITVLALVVCLAGQSSAFAQGYYSNSGTVPLKSQLPKEFEEATLNEKLGDTIPLDLNFVNASGKTVPLRDYFADGKPVILNLAYYECPMLCGLLLQGLSTGVKDFNWAPGDQYRIITLSFDHNETPALAAAKKDSTLSVLERDDIAGDGWVFLTGNEENIHKLTDAVGFNFRWIESEKQFAHPAAITFLSPEGKITRYLAGYNYEPFQLKSALMESSNGSVGSALDYLVNVCFQYNNHAGKYTLAVTWIMRTAGYVTMLIVAAVIGILLLREFHKRRQEQPSGDA